VTILFFWVFTVDTELIVTWVLTLVGSYIATGVFIPSITGPVTHCSDSDTDCSVTDLSANPYILVLNPLIGCDIMTIALIRFSLF
jgi:hypothetical protein